MIIYVFFFCYLINFESSLIGFYKYFTYALLLSHENNCSSVTTQFLYIFFLTYAKLLIFDKTIFTQTRHFSVVYKTGKRIRKINVYVYLTRYPKFELNFT